jgi:hypothetical protein
MHSRDGPRGRISHTADESGLFAFEVKLAAIKLMFESFKNSRAFGAFRGSELTFFCLGRYPATHCDGGTEGNHPHYCHTI